MALKVIGTGFGRTGTMSLKMALEQIGFGKCYHMYELIHQPDDIIYFEKAENGEQVNWDTLFEGYQSAVDMPIILFYKELISKYPDAKIIHTTRDAESWYKSFKSTILWAVKPSPWRIIKMLISLPFSKKKRKFFRVIRFNGGMITRLFGKDISKEKVLKYYNEYNTEALNYLPKDRLLVYDIKSGWEPLCNFLNVSIPATEFPRANSTEEFISNVKKS